MTKEEGMSLPSHHYNEHTLMYLLPFQGMAIAPFAVLAAGKIRTDAEEQKRRETGEKGMSYVSHLTVRQF